MIVCIDPGHVGYDTGNVNNGRKETDYTWPVSLFFQDALKRCGIEALLTRYKDGAYSFGSVDVELSERSNFANQKKADLFVSWHNDSFTNPEANGVAVWICNAARGTDTETIAQKVVDAISVATGQANRGVRVADYAVLVRTNMHAILIEGGFNTNPGESARLADPAFQRLQAEAAARAVCEYFKVTYVLPAESKPAGTPVLGTAQATIEQAQAWARNRGAAQDFIDLAPVFWEVGQETKVRPEVGYSVSAKETNFGKFTGIVPRLFRNWGGMKVKEGGSDSDPKAHQVFETDEQGIRAVFQHLSLYAGQEAQSPIYDPRYFTWIKGKATTVEALGGSYNGNPEYGQSIVRDYLVDLLATPEPQKQTDWKQEAVDWARTKGYLTSEHSPLEQIDMGTLCAVLRNMVEK